MLYQLRKKIQTRRFEWITRAIRATTPVRLHAAPWTFVSMVGDDDVQLYLLAMKTLYRRLQRGNVVAIVAKTISQTQRDLRPNISRTSISRRSNPSRPAAASAAAPGSV